VSLNSSCLERIADAAIYSHAHEEDIPGTVNLRAIGKTTPQTFAKLRNSQLIHALEGDDTAYGQALFPVPAEDPNDPLQASVHKGRMLERSPNPM
jgi:hypothetical protein